jgi:hypothetical protein
MPGFLHNRRVLLAPSTVRPEVVQDTGNQTGSGVTTDTATFTSTTKNGNGLVVGFSIPTQSARCGTRRTSWAAPAMN